MKSIDLHGVRHKDASDMMVRCCSEHEVPFVVITGKSYQMKRIVSAVAAKFGLKVRDVINNPGRVIIYEEG